MGDWTNLKKQTIALLASQGWSIRKIGAELDLTHNQVAGYGSRNGIKFKGHGLIAPPVRKKGEPRVKRADPPRASKAPPWGLPEPAPKPVVVEGVTIPPGTGSYPPGQKCEYLDGDVRNRGKRVQRARNGGMKFLTDRSDEKTHGKVYASWAEVPRCPHDALPGRPWCAQHALICLDLTSLAKENNR